MLYMYLAINARLLSPKEIVPQADATVLMSHQGMQRDISLCM